jgi:hypothetical protein
MNNLSISLNCFRLNQFITSTKHLLIMESNISSKGFEKPFFGSRHKADV